VVEVVMAIEEEFALEIPDNEADKIVSIADAVKYIASHPQVCIYIHTHTHIDTRMCVYDSCVCVCVWMCRYEADKIVSISEAVKYIASHPQVYLSTYTYTHTHIHTYMDTSTCTQYVCVCIYFAASS
jgi:acyl carrier protein